MIPFWGTDPAIKSFHNYHQGQLGIYCGKKQNDNIKILFQQIIVSFFTNVTNKIEFLFIYRIKLILLLKEKYYICAS